MHSHNQDYSDTTLKELYVYIKIGEVVASLHVKGISLPIEKLLNLDNYTLTKEETFVLTGFDAIEGLYQLETYPQPASELEVKEILIAIGKKLPSSLWEAFGAGYWKQAKALGCGDRFSPAISAATKHLRWIHDRVN